MRKLLGQLGGAIQGPFLRATAIFLLFPLNLAIRELCTQQ